MEFHAPQVPDNVIIIPKDVQPEVVRNPMVVEYVEEEADDVLVEDEPAMEEPLTEERKQFLNAKAADYSKAIMEHRENMISQLELSMEEQDLVTKDERNQFEKLLKIPKEKSKAKLARDRKKASKERKKLAALKGPKPDSGKIDPKNADSDEPKMNLSEFEKEDDLTTKIKDLILLPGGMEKNKEKFERLLQDWSAEGKTPTERVFYSNCVTDKVINENLVDRRDLVKDTIRHVDSEQMYPDVPAEKFSLTCNMQMRPCGLKIIPISTSHVHYHQCVKNVRACSSRSLVNPPMPDPRISYEYINFIDNVYWPEQILTRLADFVYCHKEWFNGLTAKKQKEVMKFFCTLGSWNSYITCT